MGRFGSDDDLLMAARCGDPAAFSALMERHRGWVCRLLAAIVGDSDGAQDLAQETFCRVFQRQGDYAPRGQFVAWLKQITVNVGRNALRTRAAEDRLGQRITAEVSTQSPPSLDDPASALASKLLQQEIASALDNLPDPQREALWLHYFAGLSIDEIAARVGCPPGTIKTRLFHGRRRLGAALLSAHEPRVDSERTRNDT